MKKIEKDLIVFGNIHNIDNINKECSNSLVLLENAESSIVGAPNTVFFNKSKLNNEMTATAYKIGECRTVPSISYWDMILKNNLEKIELEDFEDIKNTLVPLFYLHAEENVLTLYSQLRFTFEDIIFIKTGEVEEYEQFTLGEIFNKALELHRENFVFLGNHQCYYRKMDSSKEIEYKFNILDDSDPWVLISDIFDDFKNSKVENFIFEYHDEFQKWEYMNYMFEIYGNESEKGYISFIPQTNGKYLIKRKIYQQDQLSRTEIHYKNVDVKVPLREYIEKEFNVEYNEFPPFRRVRYDINIECVETGNVHGIFFDYISVEGKSMVLKQCEIEYLRTRSLFENDKYKEELLLLKEYMVNFFEQRNVRFEETFFSKLSFMKKACDE